MVHLQTNHGAGVKGHGDIDFPRQQFGKIRDISNLGLGVFGFKTADDGTALNDFDRGGKLDQQKFPAARAVCLTAARDTLTQMGLTGMIAFEVDAIVGDHL